MSFTALEIDLLAKHPKWSTRIVAGGTKMDRRGGMRLQRRGQATLTRSEINDVCDVLGVNGREWLSKHVDGEEPPTQCKGPFGDPP